MIINILYMEDEACMIGSRCLSKVPAGSPQMFDLTNLLVNQTNPSWANHWQSNPEPDHWNSAAVTLFYWPAGTSDCLPMQLSLKKLEEPQTAVLPLLGLIGACGALFRPYWGSSVWGWWMCWDDWLPMCLPPVQTLVVSTKAGREATVHGLVL